MYQTFNEPIMVAGVFNHQGFQPRKFRWRQRDYRIETITVVTNIKDGGVIKRGYGVVAGGNVYRLEFNRSTDHWQLIEVWYEG